jgi:hypothetical protein
MTTTNGTVNGTGQALAVRQPQAMAQMAPADTTRTFEPQSMGELMSLAGTLAASGLIPSVLRGKPADVAIILMTGREYGLPPMTALRSIHVIDGKPVMSADLIVGLIKNRREVCEYFQLLESSDAVATYETKRVGDPAPVKLSFTMEQAKAAGLAGKDNWKKYPATMLRRRCATMLGRDVYPDVAGNTYDPDEIPEQPPRDVTPPRPVPQPPPAKAAPREEPPAVVVEAEPVADPVTGEVAEVAQSDAFVTLSAQLAAATTSDDLNECAKAISAAKAANAFLPGEREKLRDDYKALDIKIRRGGKA